MIPVDDPDHGVPADQLTPEVRGAIERLQEENALLRAALADTRARIGDLEQAADTDPVTGLPGERSLARQLERAVSQAGRHGTPSALIMIDLRGLASINDRHGRIAGDAALSHVARLLGQLIRASDSAARSGAGFALLLDHLDPDSAVDTGERIAQFIAAHPLDLGRAQVALEAIVGVATILPGDEAGDVLARAQRNLERVKEF
ncbi:GGDEF domain-containing protein [Sphingosinicella terrae]|jgi:diguanylate cyclase (GGDEF)-like protein|uniref:GGDEF domain-containing protein n=1 Tax=Sphingosinicella terrae TaxID=2172047 RepID=UPI0013B4761D|nr:GGDEF domain-containing protein [Sphingosinicella terrae]